VIGWQKKKDYVERRWTDLENEDFQRFTESIGVMPSDAEWAAAMENGEIDFFNNDPFVGVKLYRA
jgi:hypothetical protein